MSDARGDHPASGAPVASDAPKPSIVVDLLMPNDVDLDVELDQQQRDASTRVDLFFPDPQLPAPGEPGHPLDTGDDGH